MKILRAVVCTLGLLLSVSAAHAQSFALSADVPFDFIVGKQVYPAGNYQLRSLNSPESAIIIRNTDDSSSSITLTQSCLKTSPAEKTVLMFHRLGNEYFLDQVWVAGRESGRRFFRSPIETQMARNYNDREAVIVAALITR